MYPGKGCVPAVGPSGGCGVGIGWLGTLTGVKPDPVLENGGAAPGKTAAPHAAQNWAPAGTSAPHFEQRTAMKISCEKCVKRDSDQCRTQCFRDELTSYGEAVIENRAQGAWICRRSKYTGRDSDRCGFCLRIGAQKRGQARACPRVSIKRLVGELTE